MTGRIRSRGRVVLDQPSPSAAQARESDGRQELAYLIALAGATTEVDALDVICELAPAAFGAAAAEIALLNFRLELEIAGRVNLSGDAGHSSIVSLDEPDELARAVRTGEAVWLPDNATAEFRSSCVLPLRARDRILGGIVLWFAEPHAFDDAERSVLIATAAQTGKVLERARLFSSEQRVRLRAEGAADRLARLQSVTAGLSGAYASGDIADVVVGQAVSELRASSGALLMLDDEGVLRLVRQMGADLWHDTSLEEMLPIAEAARTKRLVLLSSAEQRIAHYPSTQNMPAGHQSLAAVPLVLKGATLGVVALTFPDNREFGKEETTFLSSLGLQCAQALERAHLYEAERRAHRLRAEEARVLQQHLLPREPFNARGLQIAARYRPFGDGTTVGGDFYDVFPIRPGCFGIVMGDVSGKGVAAASVTAIARYTIRAVASHGSPRDALLTLNRIMLEERLDDRFCTVVHAHIDVEPDGARMTLAIGGHPDPLLVRPDGEVRALGIPGSAIGLFGDPRVHDAEIKLERGDAVLFYTDGVIEARDATGELFEPHLAAVARENAGAAPDTIADAIEHALRSFQHGASRDDVGLLVLRIPEETT